MRPARCVRHHDVYDALYALLPRSSSENMVPLALTNLHTHVIVPDNKSPVEKTATFPATRAKGRVPRGALPCARGRRYASCTNKAARHRPGGEVHMPTYIMIAGVRLIHARSTSTTTLFLTTGNSGRLYALLVTAAVWCVPFFRYRLVFQKTKESWVPTTNSLHAPALCPAPAGKAELTGDAARCRTNAGAM